MAPRTRAAAAGEKRRCLVTGGSGFVGRHLVDQLLDSGRWEVTVFDIRAVEGEERAKYIVGDLRDASQVAAACKGMDVVFHVATAAPTAANAHNEALMRAVNIDGTQNMVDGCVAGGVQTLIYTSSASVVFDGHDLHKVDEAAPYAARPMDYYTHTKIEGEKLVLGANGRGGLATCALRPSGIFGEYDTLLVPTTVKNAKAGKMKYLIGSGRNKMDWTYAGNVAQAHIQAADALTEGGPESALGGKAYFITNDDPRPFWGFMGDLCEGLGYGRPRIRLPFWLIYFIALIVQYLVTPLLRLFGKELQSDFTPFRIALSAANRTFSCSAAYRDFGYVPKVPMDEALKRTLRHFSHLHASKHQEG
jgi:sterol-4alpha-carboxylate 3-dehydrogenase (decarboxylating)